MAKDGPSERVTRILLSRGMGLMEIQTLTETQAWDVVYATPAARSAAPQRLRVCFTGFGSDDLAELESMAMAAGHNVSRGVIKSLRILVCGDNAGPAKLEKARAQGVQVLTAAEYRELVKGQDKAHGDSS